MCRSFSYEGRLSKIRRFHTIEEILQSVQSQKIEILFSNLEIETLCIGGYAEAGFATNKDLTSQLGMIVVLMDGIITLL